MYVKHERNGTYCRVRRIRASVVHGGPGLQIPVMRKARGDHIGSALFWGSPGVMIPSMIFELQSGEPAAPDWLEFVAGSQQPNLLGEVPQSHEVSPF